MAKSKRRIPKRKATAKKRGPIWKRQQAAYKGWETRRERERKEEREQQRRARIRRQRAEEKAEREARRLAKWRKSYAEYLKFRIPKAEREELAVPAKKELVCRVLFDSDEFDERQEHIWTNFETLMGPSINQVLVRIPGEEGIVRGTFRLIEGEEFARMQAGGMEDFEDEDYGNLHVLEWELDTETRLFWSAYYANARTLLPARPEKGGQDYKASWLGVVRFEICYAPGEAEE